MDEGTPAPVAISRDHSPQWSLEIMASNVLLPSRVSLCQEVQDFEKTMSSTDKDNLESEKEELEKMISDITNHLEAKKRRLRDHGWLRKAKPAVAKFCETVYHYQNIFDVLNSQAPEYTTAVWGGIKILLLVSVNNQKLRDGVVTTLTEIGHQFSLVKIFLKLQPSAVMAEHVCKVYHEFNDFLSEALRYYKENRAKQIIKSLTSPWEIRFKDRKSHIETSVKRVMELAGVKQLISTQRTAEQAEEISITQMHMQRQQSLNFHLQLKLHEQQSQQLSALKQQIEAIEISLHQFPGLPRESSGLYLLQPDASENNFDSPDNADRKQPELLTKYLHPQQSVDVIIQRAFPHVTGFLVHLQSCIDRYAPQHSTIVTLQRKFDLLSWERSNSSELLWVDGYMDGQAAWSTNLCLELIGAVSTFQAVTCLHHFSIEADPKTTYPAEIVQWFIVQLLDRYAQSFSWEKCKRYQVTMERLERQASSVTKMGILLQECIEIVQPTSMYIIIDGIDALYEGVRADGQKTEEFEHLLDLLKTLAMHDRMLCKILITSRSAAASGHLASSNNRPMDPAHHKMIILPRGAHRDTQERLNQRSFRIVNRVSTDEALVGNASKLLESDSSESEAEITTEDVQPGVTGSSNDFDWEYDIVDRERHAKLLRGESVSPPIVSGSSGHPEGLEDSLSGDNVQRVGNPTIGVPISDIDDSDIFSPGQEASSDDDFHDPVFKTLLERRRRQQFEDTKAKDTDKKYAENKRYDQWAKYFEDDSDNDELAI